MAEWTWKTDHGEFHIQVIGPINLLFQNDVIGSYPTTQEAAVSDRVWSLEELVEQTSK
jgi:hypothetical protein